MASYAWKARLAPGRADDYRIAHDELWPEMAEVLSEAGFITYRIFRRDLELFGYFETDDLLRLQSVMAASEVRARWSAKMQGILEPEIDPATGFPRLLERVFDLDDHIPLQPNL